jgi:ABC-2 type transport system permease protein
MLHDIVDGVRAELPKQARRPAHWLLLALAATLTLTFGYLIPYAGLTGATSGGPSTRGLGDLLPDQMVGNVIAGTPVFVGAFAVIFGVLVVGSEYGWETWKTLLAQRPSRLRLYLAKLVVTAIGAAVLVLGLFTVGLVGSVGVAALEDQALTWPSAADVGTGFLGGWLICGMWAGLGVLLGIALRGVAMPVGLGLVWLLAVQNLISAIAAPLLDWVADLQKVLPGPNAGSLVSALGAPAGTPGVDSLVGSAHATLVLAGYLVAFTVAGGWLLYRRDIL